MLSQRWFAPFCIGMFYSFLALGSFRAWASLTSFDLAGVGTMLCIVLWWTQDSAKRGRPLPLLSISVNYAWLPATLAIHLLRTRGWRGLPKVTLHVAATSLILWGWLLHPGTLALRPVPRPSAEQMARWQAYGISSNVMSYVEGSGRNVRALTLRQDDSHPAPLRGVMFEYQPDESQLIVDDARAFVAYLRRVAAPGEIPFLYEGATIAVARAHQPYDVMRAAETNANNYGIGTDQIIRRMQDWDRRYGVTLYGIGFDWIGVELHHLPDDVDAFAREVYKFCPDAVDQGFQDVGALAADIARNRSVHLWWD
jgi:hypothetical protein